MIAPQWLDRLLPRGMPEVNASAAGLAAKDISRIEEFLASSAAEGKMVGAVALISRNGKIACHRAFGWRDREAADPMRKDSIFRILSMTKSVTCAALLALADDGKLSPQDPVELHLPEFAGVRFADGRKPASPPRLWQLMAHSSGLVDAFPPEFSKTEFTLSDIASLMARTPLGFEPGAGWGYSNGGLSIVGRVIEKLSGTRYADFVQRRILRPLRMNNSFFRVPAREQKRMAAIYRIGEGTVSRETEDPINSKLKYVSPENGLQTTVADVWRFYEMIRNRGLSGNRRVLSEASARAMVTVQTEDRNAGFLPGMGYGYGFSIVTAPNGIFRNHSAGSFGHGSYYQTHGWADPAKGIVGLLFCQNRADAVIVTEEAAQFVTMLGALA
jgi:CubicO group peptidase (beta-lactamase class C family)